MTGGFPITQNQSCGGSVTEGPVSTMPVSQGAGIRMNDRFCIMNIHTAYLRVLTSRHSILPTEPIRAHQNVNLFRRHLSLYSRTCEMNYDLAQCASETSDSNALLHKSS